MSRTIRFNQNEALIVAQQIAQAQSALVEIWFVVYPSFPYANTRNMHFLLSGLSEVSKKAAAYQIPVFVYCDDPAKVFETALAQQEIVAIITEQHVLKPILTTQAKIQKLAKASQVAFQMVSTATVVPVTHASSKLEFAARTFRPKIMGMYKNYLAALPLVKKQEYPSAISIFDEKQISEIITAHPHWKRLSLSTLVSGEDAAKKQLDTFIKNNLDHVHNRNLVAGNGQSYLSAYLHFGMLSAKVMISQVLATNHPNAALFIEEALVRRELAENYCHYCKDYDNLNGAWDWAKQTLAQHQMDKREYLYDLEAFEQAKTHDKLWNYCQKQVVETGYLHSYLRMYWAKMVLYWSENAQKAIEILIYLNDTYFLDGRDPNGYTGIMWSVAGVHDRPWFNRPVIGLIRSMVASQTLKKTKIELD